MSILLFIVLGLVAGLLARAITPGRQSMGLVATTILGMVGSFVGGLVASLFTNEPVLALHSSGIIGSVIGAIAVLLIVGFASRRGHVRSYV
ncbi:MAG: hypothetical protein JWO86_4437 [Myxococcaceae bacterium]|jgi:uncharacterized membrane protein YeaQ/YmgE (transglycosylase-associated protein family)|nr:hypothetical protein [Myxococcaceae bacterium]MEA2748900.1 hypothetical protein [Myxococcales bacterium]